MLTIQLTPLSYRIPVARNGQLQGTNLYLDKYLQRFSHIAWNHQLRRTVLMRRYLYYNPTTRLLHLPRYDFLAFCQFLRDNRVAYDTEELPLQSGLPVDIQLKPGVWDRDPRQTEAITYLTTTPECHRGLSLGTGIGKTYCTIRTLSVLGKRAMVCMAGLVDQWKESLLGFTTLTEADIYVIQGAPSMTKLLTGIDRTLFPKVILCSLGTIRHYATDNPSYENYPPFETLFDRLRVGVKVVDEAHLNFWLNLTLDLRTNAGVNIALTATFDRGEFQVKQVFDQHYPPSVRFGENVFKRYIDIYSYSYSLGGTLTPKSYSTQKGYNHSLYEGWLLRKTTKLEYLYGLVYSPMIHAHYVNVRRPGQKLLVLCSSIDMCKWFKRRLLQDLPTQENFTIETYNYGDSDEVLKTHDIIISTPGSAGTGTDIKNLRTMVMTIATGSENLNKQSLGRLRELENGDIPIYAYAWCRDIPSHNTYQESRRNTYTLRGRSFQEIQM